MYSNNKLWEWGLSWVANYGTLIKLSIWHRFMIKYYQYRHLHWDQLTDMTNVVITTKSVTKCIFLNFGAIPKRMVKLAKLISQKLKLQCRVHIKFIYKNKSKVFTEKKTKLKIPTLFLFLLLPYPSFFPCPLLPPPLPSPWLPSTLFDISYKI